MATVIDSHHHFWNYSPTEYAWIDDDKKILRRDFGPSDLSAVAAPAGVNGVISVQARQTVEETDWLLSLAERHDFIQGVVGWAPLIDADLRRRLDGWSGRKKLLGLRHVLQDEPDDRYMLRPDFDRGVALLEEYDLVYDILIFERQLPGSIELVDRHPALTFVLDHVAKPRIGAGEMAPWSGRIRELARRPNVYCKISGMTTEADWATWTPAQLLPYFEMALEAFGPRRLMFGSDWPVCLLASSYEKWIQTARDWTGELSTSENDRIWGETAREAYRLA
ncbi:MAG TPA: amidohydrolase family protein [Tepidisphaeraceae bacterium]|jgi:L-fuconolactonase|nr:amidohydrolase family protein [Tepidisphaeraceae bacterium]